MITFLSLVAKIFDQNVINQLAVPRSNIHLCGAEPFPNNSSLGSLVF